jgi:hypothetical protein
MAKKALDLGIDMKKCGKASFFGIVGSIFSDIMPSTFYNLSNGPFFIMQGGWHACRG